MSAANKILKIRRTIKRHRFESIDPWRYTGKTEWNLRAKKNKKNNKNTKYNA